MLLDLAPGEFLQDQCCRLLDALRAYPVPGAYPFMIMSTTEALAESLVAPLAVEQSFTWSPGPSQIDE